MLVEIKKYRYMEDVLAKGAKVVFDAVVGKCTPYGVFVDLPEIAIGGMVHVSKLSQSFVRWDAFKEALVDGQKTWQVGAKMKVRVAAVDFDQRKIDFVPANAGACELNGLRRGKKSERPPRRKNERHSRKKRK